jgi:hypothetical protein
MYFTVIQSLNFLRIGVIYTRALDRSQKNDTLISCSELGVLLVLLSVINYEYRGQKTLFKDIAKLVFLIVILHPLNLSFWQWSFIDNWRLIYKTCQLYKFSEMTLYQQRYYQARIWKMFKKLIISVLRQLNPFYKKTVRECTIDDMTAKYARRTLKIITARLIANERRHNSC